MDKIHKMVWVADQQAEILAIMMLLSAGLEGMPEYKALKEVTLNGLLKNFACLWIVMNNCETHSHWCKLTWPVVMVVLQDPSVQTDSEDTVVCLIDTWLSVNAVVPNSTLYIQVMSDMLKVLRVAHVSPSMSDALVKSGLLDSSTLMAVNHVMGTSTGPPRDADLQARLITCYQNICPAHWFKARPALRTTMSVTTASPSGSFHIATFLGPSTAMSITLKAPFQDLEDSYGRLPNPSTFLSPRKVYFKGWSLNLCLDISGDLPTNPSAKVSIVYMSAAQTLAPVRNPSPLLIEVLSPLGIVDKHLILMESAVPGNESKIVLLERPASSPLTSDAFWSAFAVGKPEKLKIKMSIATV
jgi:hypothetical protein